MECWVTGCGCGREEQRRALCSSKGLVLEAVRKPAFFPDARGQDRPMSQDDRGKEAERMKKRSSMPRATGVRRKGWWGRWLKSESARVLGYLLLRLIFLIVRILADD